MLELVSTPRRDDTPIESDVAGALSQLPYRFQRKDETHVGSNTNAGFQRILIGSALPMWVEVGQLVYVFGADLVLGVATITAIGITDITVDKPFTVNIGAGWVNFIGGLPGYKILLEPVEALSGESLLPYPEAYAPRDDGSLFVSVSAMLAVIQIEGLTRNYRLRYHEYYAGVIQTTVTDDPVFAVAARRQLLDVGGSNMWAYLPNPDPLGKATTLFENAFHWVGYRTNVYSIWDKDVYTRSGAISIGFRFQALDVNQNILFQSAATVEGHEVPAIYLDWIPPEFDDIENIYYVKVFMNTTAPLVDLSEPVLYKVKKPCANPVMLEWLNKNGVGEQWLFDVMQDENREALPGQSYEKPITDTLDNVNDTLNRLSLGTIQRITLFADQITKDQIRALHGIKESLFVWLWLDQTGDNKIKVVVEDMLNTSINTKAVFGAYSCQIRLPRNFDIYKNA